MISPNMKPIVSFFAILSFSSALFAQDDDPPLLMPEERRAVDTQSAEFSEAITPALAAVSKSTVRVWSGARRVAYGTVIGDGTKVLSKWSEIARGRGSLKVDVAGAEYRAVTPSGVYPDEDLVVLDVEGAPLTPVKWSFEAPKLGSFLAAPQPDGRLAAFGVVSVLERNLKDTDLAYLGVIGDPKFTGQGVRVHEVTEGSGALQAGLQPGNIILKVGDRQISGLLALRNSLVGVAPGSTVSLLVESKGAAKTVDVIVGNRPKLMQFTGDRLAQMERMGGAISQVRDSFTHAIQTDMRPKPNQVGGPVVDLQGRVVGITLARADRTRSFVMPSAAVVDLLKNESQNPAVAEVRTSDEEKARVAARGMAPRDRTLPGQERRMRRHLAEMRRLMEHMQQEMEGIEDEP
jgi:membrane-associated protease RseP (regulator of RpoE activity)